MSTLGRWLAWRFLRAYLTFAFSFALFFLVIDGFVNLSKLSRGDVLTNLVQRYGRMLPELFYMLSPFITLLAAMWVVAALRRANELVPLAAAGFSPRQIATPLLVLGLLFAPLCWADRELLLPRLAHLRRAHLLHKQILNPRPVPDAQNGVLSVKAYMPEDQLLQHASYVRLNERNGEAFTIISDRVTYSAEREGWTFHDGVVITREEGGESIARIDSAGTFLPSQIRLSDVEASIGSPMFLSAAELKEQIDRTPGFKHLAVQYWERFTQPLAGVVLLLIAIPLVLGGEGGLGTFLRFLGCLGVAVLQFMLSTFCSELAARDVLGPAAAAFLPQLLIAGTGAFLIWKSR